MEIGRIVPVIPAGAVVANGFVGECGCAEGFIEFTIA
jgi:hypothetical protein